MTSTARKELNMTYAEFAAWLSEATGQEIEEHDINRFESDGKSPSKNLRKVLAPIAARHALKKINNTHLSDSEAIELIVSSQR